MTLGVISISSPGGAAALLATLIVPALFLVACRSRRWRERMPRLLFLAPLPALAAACFVPEGAAVVLDPARLRLTLTLAPPRALLLGAVALLWSCAGAYTGAYLRDDRYAGRFAVYWLLTLTGCLGVFLAGDLASFYLLYSLMSLAAYGLVVHDGTAPARRAAMVYLVLAVLGEAFLLLAFVLLAAAAPGDSVLIRDVVAALPASPLRAQTLMFLILGFGLKMGLVPLHGWLPLAHPAAPMPASAVLSGAIIKTGVIGFIALLPLGTVLTAWGMALTVIGMVTAFYAVTIGVTQANPKTVLAYSSVSQMGLVAALLGVGLATGRAEAGMAAAFYAVHHVLVKGALFLAVGVVGLTPARVRWRVLLPCAVLALSFAGLPLTGGAVAKLATKPYFDSDLLKVLATLSAAGSALLMLHFMGRLAALAPPETDRPAPAGMIVPWAITAIAAVVVPWSLYSAVLGGGAGQTLDPKALWAALWPVLVGAGLAVVLHRWGKRLPRIPEGDVICTGERVARAAMAQGRVLDPLDAALRRWPVAGAALLALTLIFVALLFAGGPP